MDLLYTNIPPLKVCDSSFSFIESFNQEIATCDTVDLAVGYVSQASLEELRNLVSKYKLKVCLIMGMYYIEGMQERTYHLAERIHQEWESAGLGEIRLVKSFKYHGKIYAFSKNGKVSSIILGSANLGAIKFDSNNRRQYEVSIKITDEHTCQEAVAFIEKLKSDKLSFKINAGIKVPLISEKNDALNNMGTVHQVPTTDLGIYERHKIGTRFLLPLKAPHFAERFIDDGKHYTQSNINTCYSEPRSARKARDWYEIQFTVPSSVYKLEGYPQRGKPFLVITDDGYSFKVHTTSDNNKQFNAVGNEHILGRWLKGRLAAAGLATEVPNVLEDHDRIGMITEEMLDSYGCHNLYLQKTDKTAEDTDGVELEVWLLGFAFDKALAQDDSDQKGN